MSRKIYNRLSFMAVSWLDESTLGGYWRCFCPHAVVVHSEANGARSDGFARTLSERLRTARREFTENAWIGQIVAIGDAVRLSITGPCARCVMTTLPQGDLPKDVGILRTAAQHNHANVGVYASVLQSGKVRRGDSATLQYPTPSACRGQQPLTERALLFDGPNS